MSLTSNKLLTLLFVSVLLYSCSGSMNVSASKADPAELKNYKTYAWIAPGDTALNTRRDDKIYAGLIESSANKELKNKGMKMDNQNPDVVFMFDTRIEERVEYRNSPNTTAPFGSGGYAYGYNGVYYSGAYDPMYGLKTSPITIEEGTLSYSMFDRKTGKLMWKGAVIKNLTSKTNIEATIKKGTILVFAKLPIRHK